MEIDNKYKLNNKKWNIIYNIYEWQNTNDDKMGIFKNIMFTI